MTNNPSSEMETAQKVISEILNRLNIKSVIYVDDVFEQKIRIEKILGWVTQGYQAFPNELEQLLPDVILDDPDQRVLSDTFNHYWQSLNDVQKEEFIESLVKICGNRMVFSKDLIGVTNIKAYFGDLIDFVTPSDWVSTKKKIILETSSPKSKYLCLFDHNLSEAATFQEEGSRSGAGLIHDLLSTDNHENVICGLVTHTIQDIPTEMARWKELQTTYQIKLSDFLPLAKMRLEDPILFADGIKKTVLNGYCEQLKSILFSTLDEAIKNALKKVSDIDVYDFEYMVLRSSFESSEWEALTLIRLFQIFERDEIFGNMLLPENLINFNHVVNIARPIAELLPSKHTESLVKVSRSIRHQELFEGEHLIKCTPLQAGDIFQSPNGNFYILLAQPCDLIVRKKGSRNNERQVVPLIPVICKKEEDLTAMLASQMGIKGKNLFDNLCQNEHKEKLFNALSEKKVNFWKNRIKLEYFVDDPSIISFASFPHTKWVNTEILDLAILDPEGRCCLNVFQTPNINDQLPYWWQLHLIKLTEKYSSIADEFNTINRAFSEAKQNEIVKKIYANSFHLDGQSPNFINVSFNEGIFDFGLVRKIRLREPNASRLLKNFSQFLSRDAFEMDIAEPDIAWDLPEEYR